MIRTIALIVILTTSVNANAIDLISPKLGGGVANSSAVVHSISADGTKIVYESQASDLIASDTNNQRDVFVYDAADSSVKLVSATSGGTQGDGRSGGGKISGDGNFVLFYSRSTNFVAEDNDSDPDCYLKNLVTNELTLISKNPGGNSGDGLSCNSPEDFAINGDGSVIVFSSRATDIAENPDADYLIHIYIPESDSFAVFNPVPGAIAQDPDISEDGNIIAFAAAIPKAEKSDPTVQNIYTYNRTTSETQLISQVGGVAGTGESNRPSISSDGKVVYFLSFDTSLDPRMLSGNQQVFRSALAEGDLELITVSGANEEANSAASSVMANGDGELATFVSSASNLGTEDPNSNSQVFVFNAFTRTFSVVSKDDSDQIGNDTSSSAVLDSAGTSIALTSAATNFVQNDTNGFGDAFLVTVDHCPSDDNKEAPGVCGCGVSDQDANGNGAPDCLDPVLQQPPATTDTTVERVDKKHVRITFKEYEGVVTYQYKIKGRRKAKRLRRKGKIEDNIREIRLPKGKYNLRYRLIIGEEQSPYSSKIKFK